MGYITLGSAQALTDWQGQAQDFLDEYLPLEWVTPPEHAYGSDYGALFPPPNWTGLHKLRPNQACWPTGAARWGYGYLLMTGVEKAKVPPNVKVGLEIDTPRYRLATSVYPLTARQILYAPGSQQNAGLWIVPFVDQRYWWQCQAVQLDIGAAQSTTWTQVIAQLGAALEVTITHPAIDAGYLFPSSVLGERRMSAAILLDAVAQSLGLRVVRKWDDSIHLEGVTEAKTAYDSNALVTPEHCLTGLSYSPGPLPTAVDLVCRPALYGAICPGRDDYRASYVTTGPNRITSPYLEYQIRSAVAANWTDPVAPDPANKLQLDGLVGLLGDAFEGWRERIYSHAFSGIQAWDLCGFDDWILHQFGTELKDYEVDNPDPAEMAKIEKVWRPTSTTSVLGYPENYLYTRNFSSDADYVPEGEQFLVKLTEDLLPGQTAAAEILSWHGSSTSTGVAVVVEDYHPDPAPAGGLYGATCALVGEVIWVRPYRTPSAPDTLQSCRPFGDHSHGLIRIAIPTGDIQPAASGSAVIQRGDGSAGPTVTIYNGSLDPMKAGKLYGILWVTTADPPGWFGFGGAGGGQAPGMVEFTLGPNGLALTEAFCLACPVTKVWNGEDPGATIDAWNTSQQFQGPPGTAGLAVQNLADGRWQILVLWDRQARFIEFETTEAFDRSDATVAVTLTAFWDGVDPSPVTEVANPGGLFYGKNGEKGIARRDFYSAVYKIVYCDRWRPLRWTEFTTGSQTFLPSDNGPITVNVAAGDEWNGDNAGPTIGVMNTQNIFRSDQPGSGGVAAEQVDGTWQIVQLLCIPPASQAVFASDQTDPSLPSYGGAATPLPFAAFEHSAGDLFTINASNEIQLTRASRGAVRIEIGANWGRQAGPSETETSVLEFQIDFGQGAGWETVTSASLMMTHVYQRIPPTNYIMGGSASRSYWSQVIWPIGTRVRVTARSEGGTTITSMNDFYVEIVESYDVPLGAGAY